MKAKTALTIAVLVAALWSGVTASLPAQADEGSDHPASVYCKTAGVQDESAAYACRAAPTVDEACAGAANLVSVDKRDIQTTDPQAAQCPDGSWVTRFELK